MILIVKLRGDIIISPYHLYHTYPPISPTLHVEENKKKIVRQTSASSWEQKGTDCKAFPGPSIFFHQFLLYFSIIFSMKGASAQLLHFPGLPHVNQCSNSRGKML